MATVYLAGGMDAGWRNLVMEACPKHNYISPAHRNDVALDDPEQYCAWDLAGVRHSDLMLGYVARNNNSGYGLALEVGYALALGIPVILVDDRNDERMAIVRAAASVCLASLYDAINFLLSVTW